MCELTAVGDIGCEVNSPGLTDIYYALQDEVSAIPAVDAGTNQVSTDLTMVATKFFKKLEFSDESGIMREGAQGEIDGKSFFQEIEAFVPKIRDAVHVALKNAINAKMILIVVDDNANQWIIGDLQKPARLQTADGETGAGGTDRNGIPFVFRVNSISHPPYLYTGTITTS